MKIRLIDSDQWEEIFDSLSRNRSRTFLTAFGIFWGIFMLVLLMGGGKGLQSLLGENFAGFAANSGFMISNQTSEPYKGFRSGRYWQIELDDVERVKRSIPQIDVVTPTIRRWGGQARSENHSCNVSLTGMRADYNLVDNPKIRYGRELTEADNINCRKVCVIGSRVAEELFPNLGNKPNPCGKYLQIDSIYYQIVGVSGKGSGGIAIGGNPTTSVYLPYKTMQKMYNRGSEVDILCLTAYDQYRMSDVQYDVDRLLKRVHMVHPDDTQALIKVNAEAIFSMIDSLFSGVSILVWMIGLGTLIAGAIGVSNIMVVTVKERTTEIGIRRAIGATPRNILMMIMSESIVLTLLAGMSGICMAVMILNVMEQNLAESSPNAQFQVTFGVAIGAALLLVILGVLAGLAPALRAMKIKPVDAMREE